MVVDKAKLIAGCGRRSDRPFYGRGGEKLAGALDEFHDPKERICFDVGCSTGGFYGLPAAAAGARRVYAVDVGYGQFEWRLRQDPRVVLMERTNIRHLAPDAIPEPWIDLIVIDVSFISRRWSCPCVCTYLSAWPDHHAEAAIPKWEGTRREGGIVQDDGAAEGLQTRSLPVCRVFGLDLAGHVGRAIEGRNRGDSWFCHKA